MGTGSFPKVKRGQGVTLTPHPLLVPWSWKSRAIPLLPLWAVRPVQSLSVCTRVHFILPMYLYLYLYQILWQCCRRFSRWYSVTAWQTDGQSSVSQCVSCRAVEHMHGTTHTVNRKWTGQIVIKETTNAPAFLNIFAWDIWTHVLSWGQMFDFKCGTTNVEATISIAYLIFISMFYNNTLYVLMHLL
jgi:hypothetical protein